MARGRGGGKGSSRGQTHVAAASYKSSRSSGASKGSSTWAARGSAAAYGKSGTKDAAAAGAYKASRAHGGSKSDAKAAARGAAAAYDQMHGEARGNIGYSGYSGYYFPNTTAGSYGQEPWHRQYDDSAGTVTLPTYVDNQGRMCIGQQNDGKYYVGTDWKEVYEKGGFDEPAIETKTPEETEKKKSGGCYVATCVYGSYDCPEVWVLRRFRDNRLMKNWPGRAFVKAYYATSPWLVEKAGDKEGFRAICRSLLDNLVSNLRMQGISEAPYEDPIT